MTNFKAFFRIVQKNIWLIVMYTVILVIMSVANVTSGNNMTNFTAAKPDVVVYDRDNSEISRSLLEYFKERTTINEIAEEGDALEDALYYDTVDYVIYLEKGFGEAVISGENPEVIVKSIGNYDAYLAETILNRFIAVMNSFARGAEGAGAVLDAETVERAVVEQAKVVLENETKVELNTKLDTNGLANAATYYSFLNFAILAGLVFAISFATIGFRSSMVKKRIRASATSYRKINADLLTCSFILAVVLWLIFNVIGILLVGADVVFSANGLLMVANSLILTIFATVFAMLLSNLLQKTSALNAVINVVSIGSSFICGVFIPVEWMPEFVIGISKALPSYYYVTNNHLIAKLEKFDWEHLQPIVINAAVILGVTVVLVIVNNIVTKKKH